MKKPDTDKLIQIEAKLRYLAKCVEEYRIGSGIDIPNPAATVLDDIFEGILEQADQIRVVAQPITVTYPKEP